MTNRGMMLALFVLTVGLQTGPPPAAVQRKTTVETMAPGRAKALFEDARVKMFLNVASQQFGGTCTVPDYAQTKATISRLSETPAGTSMDFVSDFYDVTVPCSGKVNVVTLRAEFTPISGPLNLVLSIDLSE